MFASKNPPHNRQVVTNTHICLEVELVNRSQLDNSCCVQEPTIVLLPVDAIYIEPASKSNAVYQELYLSAHWRTSSFGPPKFETRLEQRDFGDKFTHHRWIYEGNFKTIFLILALQCNSYCLFSCLGVHHLCSVIMENSTKSSAVAVTGFRSVRPPSKFDR